MRATVSGCAFPCAVIVFDLQPSFEVPRALYGSVSIRART